MSARSLGQSRPRLAWRVVALALLGFAPVTSPATASGIATCEEPFVFPDKAVNVIIAPYEFTVEARDPEAKTDVGETGRQLTLALELDTVLTARYPSLGVIAVLPQQATTGVKKCTADSIVSGLLWRKDKYVPQPGQALIIVTGLIYQEGEDLLLQTKLRSGTFHQYLTRHHAKRPRRTHNRSSGCPGRGARSHCCRRHGLSCIPTTPDHEVGPESDQRDFS